MSEEKVFLTPEELAERWHVSKSTLANWRSEGYGPPFVRIGVFPRYKLVDIEGYESSLAAKEMMEEGATRKPHRRNLT